MSIYVYQSLHIILVLLWSYIYIYIILSILTYHPYINNNITIGLSNLYNTMYYYGLCLTQQTSYGIAWSRRSCVASCLESFASSDSRSLAPTSYSSAGLGGTIVLMADEWYDVDGSKPMVK